jgi:hypothetical protein
VEFGSEVLKLLFGKKPGTDGAPGLHMKAQAKGQEIRRGPQLTMGIPTKHDAKLESRSCSRLLDRDLQCAALIRFGTNSNNLLESCTREELLHATSQAPEGPCRLVVQGNGIDLASRRQRRFAGGCELGMTNPTQLTGRADKRRSVNPCWMRRCGTPYYESR